MLHPTSAKIYRHLISLMMVSILSACGSSSSEDDVQQDEAEPGTQEYLPANSQSSQEEVQGEEHDNEPNPDDEPTVPLVEEDILIERAQDIIFEDMDYIPKNPRFGICHVRSLYKSMELASQGIASHALVVLGDLQAVRGIEWGYHVAPILFSEQLASFLVFDFSLATEPVTVDAWIELSDRLEQDPEYDYILLAGSQLVNVMIRDDHRLYIDRERLEADLENIKNASLAEMPPFSVAEIATACRQARRMWEFELDGESLQVKQRQLTERTDQLLDELQGRGLLEGEPQQWDCQMRLDE